MELKSIFLGLFHELDIYWRIFKMIQLVHIPYICRKSFIFPSYLFNFQDFLELKQVKSTTEAIHYYFVLYSWLTGLNFEFCSVLFMYHFYFFTAPVTGHLQAPSPYVRFLFSDEIRRENSSSPAALCWLESVTRILYADDLSPCILTGVSMIYGAGHDGPAAVFKSCKKRHIKKSEECNLAAKAICMRRWSVIWKVFCVNLYLSEVDI